MVKSILTDVEFDQDSIVSCVESEAADAPKENSKGEHIWRHGAGRQKKRLPKKGRKKSSVFVNQVKKRFLPWIMMTSELSLNTSHAL